MIFAGLLGAIAWNLLTFWLGLPTSSSHALVGGMAGAAVVRGRFDVLISEGLGDYRRLYRAVSVGRTRHRAAVDGDASSGCFTGIGTSTGLNKGFRRGQLVSAATFSLGHGGNDAQKTMGIILAVLIAVGNVPADAEVPLWVVLSAHAAIALGTLFGGWRIVKTMGFKLTKLQPSGGVAAESAAAATLFFASAQGITVSTTHTITGAIVGVGAARRMSAVRWRVAGRVLWAWIFTIPGAALVAGIFSLIMEALA